MKDLTVTRTIRAPREAVFDRLADHALYERFRRVNRSELIREGEPPPNGVGALRRIRSGLMRFEEEITAYERPSLLEYRIVKINAPFEHHGAAIHLREQDGTTQVEWTTSFRVPTPLIGRFQERTWVRQLRRGFNRVLEDVERMLASEAA